MEYFRPDLSESVNLAFLFWNLFLEADITIYCKYWCAHVLKMTISNSLDLFRVNQKGVYTVQTTLFIPTLDTTTKFVIMTIWLHETFA